MNEGQNINPKQPEVSVESVQRLESILKRQRERLDQVTGNFGERSSNGHSMV